jgi:eukaryotic-like serine/threonine-protein kinase
MEGPVEIHAGPVTSTGFGSRASRSSLSLPADLLDQSARRLRIASLVWAALWAVGLLMNNVIVRVVSPDKPLDDAWPWPGNPVAFGVIGLSLLVFWATRRGALRGLRALDVGLLYEVAIAFAIGIVNQWTPNVTGLSWICVLVVTFPVIVPHRPSKVLAAALAAASMDLVGLAITGARGVQLPETSVIVWTYLPNYICALLAVLPSHVITKLGQQVSRERRLGSYQLGALIGRGGMGEVYHATHRMLARPAAIKLIRPEVLGASSADAQHALVERFRREANAAALLGSPHTIDLYDFGVADDGTLFYVMELLEGIDLESLVVRFGPLPPERVIHLLRQVCRSLGEAHERGLVHRDIKPSNIQTCRVGLDVDFVKVFDFGLVRAEGQSLDTSLTMPGFIAGTPSFTAPEAALQEKVDRRADLYSLGCVAVWLLTGKLVFEAENHTQMMLRHIQDAPDLPSRHSPYAIPGELDAAVLACLAKNPAERPQDAMLLAAWLEAVPGVQPWTDERARSWWERNLRQVEAMPASVLGSTTPTFVRRALET